MAIRQKIKFRTPISPDVISTNAQKVSARKTVIDKLNFKLTEGLVEI